MEVFYSPVIFPVFVLYPDRNKINHEVLMPSLVIVGLLMLIIYGGIVTAFLAPAQIGVATTVLG
jgi:hypothetical protein